MQSPTRAERRRIEKLSRQYDRRGCSRCGKRSSVGSFVVTASWQVLCQGCLRPHEQAVFAAANMVMGPSDGAEADRLWFLAHPEESHRVRPALDGEIEQLLAREDYLAMLYGDPAGPPQADPYLLDTVITIQIEPGKRGRIPVRLPQDPEAVPGFVAQVVESMTERLQQSLKAAMALPPEQQVLANNAAALMPIDRMLGGKLASKVREVGEAFREGADKPRH